MPGQRGGLARRLLPAGALAVASVLLVTGCGASSRPTVGPSPTPTSPAPAPTQQSVVLGEVATSTRLEMPGGDAVILRPAHPTGAPVVYAHALGETADSLDTDPLKAGVVAALLRAGHVVAATDADGRNWGNPASLTAYVGLAHLLDPHDRGVDVLAESMGGYDAFRLPDHHRVLAVAAISPACSLPVLHDGRFRTSVATAWGPGLARGLRTLDPAVAHDWHGVALHVWASTDDPIVQATTNGFACAALARARGARVTVTHNSGLHLDPSGFVPAAVVKLFSAPQRKVRSARRPSPRRRAGL